MREQLRLLKNKLETQRLISRQHLLAATKKRLDRIDRYYRLTIGIAGLASVYSAVVLYYLHIELWFCILTSLYMLAALGYTLYLRRAMSHANQTDISLRQKFDHIIRAKRFDIRWLYFSLPFTALWLCGFYYEISRLPDFQQYLAGGIIGGIIGGGIGIRKFIKTHRNYREALRQLDILLQNEPD